MDIPIPDPPKSGSKAVNLHIQIFDNIGQSGFNSPIGSFRFHDTPGHAYSPSHYPITNDEPGIKERPNTERVMESGFKIDLQQRRASTDRSESDKSPTDLGGSFH